MYLQHVLHDVIRVKKVRESESIKLSFFKSKLDEIFNYFLQPP